MKKRAYLGRPAQTLTTTTVTMQVSRNQEAYIETLRALGWRVYASNDSALNLEEGVLAYRDQNIIERGFNRYRGKKLGLTPLHLVSTTRIKGLIRLLNIGLRVLCLVEFAVRKSLQETGSSTLDGIYAGNPKRASAKPTTEIMLKAFRGMTLNVIELNGVVVYCTTPLNAVQTRILTLIGFPPGIYQEMWEQLAELAVKMGEW